MKMVRWISGNKLTRTLNKEIQLKIGLTPIDENMMQSCLRWFGHFQRRAINVPVRNSESIKVKGMKKRGRGRKSNINIGNKRHVN